jgi:hypothetical protein
LYRYGLVWLGRAASGQAGPGGSGAKAVAEVT